MCWICGTKADSAEHRIKKSDLVRAYGRGPYNGPMSLAHFRDGKETIIQGPESKVIKYPQTLCKYCNSTYTQPFDRAYERFIDWVMKNEKVILHRRFINFNEVYGDNWENLQRDLYKYFAKSFGCRVVDTGINIPSDVVDLLGKKKFRTALRITVAVNEDVLLMPPEDRNGFI